MSKDIQIKIRNVENGFDDLFPRTKASLIEGLDEVLVHKVDKESGKGLSEANFTAEEKSKLSSIANNANNYTHPTGDGNQHVPATGTTNNGKVLKAGATAGSAAWGDITAADVQTNTTRQFVSESEKTVWNNKQNALGFTPENVAKKGQSGGYAGLDANGRVPLAQLPDVTKGQTYVVANAAERASLTGMLEGDKAYETATGNSYIYDGSAWLVLAQANWENVNLQWGNVVDGPSSTPSNIDQAVSQRHTHSNKTALDKIRDTGGTSTYDLSQFLTPSDIEDLGGGDMTKATYDTNDNGKVDLAEVAESVAWSGVTGKPSTFPSAAHQHSADDITSGTIAAARLPSGTTSVTGIVRLNNATNSTSTSQAATANAVRLTMEAAASKSKVAVSSTTPTDADLWFQEV